MADLRNRKAKEVVAALGVERVETGDPGLAAAGHEAEVLGKVGDVLARVGDAILEGCHTSAAVITPRSANTGQLELKQTSLPKSAKEASCVSSMKPCSGVCRDPD